MKIIECVPNVSEGRDAAVLEAIADTVRGVEGVELLDIDPGAETHRTVFTFVGAPEPLAEAAFRFAAKATALIDMRQHKGAHARQGAVDVIPFVPVGGGATMEDCVELARAVARRIGEELEVPIYLYEEAATREDRRSLADVRRGEYEGLEEKLRDPAWAPDFGPATFNARAGATVVGARPFLIAYNVNLNTADKKLAHDIALDIREQGRFARGSDGKILRDPDGTKQRVPGRFKNVRAVGWFIPEFGRAQVSINLTNYHVTAPHEVFEEIRSQARRRGLRVTGSEIVGLVPLEALLMAGKFYLEAQGKSSRVPEPDLVEAARVALALDDVKPFEARDAVIDYRLAPRQEGLRALSLVDFADESSRDTPAPGGGSVAAYVGALGSALASMVAGLAHGATTKQAEKNQEQRRALEALRKRAQKIKDRLLRTVDEDTAAFNGIRAAARLPRKSDEQKAARERAMVEATRKAIDVPLSVVSAAAELGSLALEAATLGLAATASDAGVAGWCARSAAEGAALNVLINLDGLPDADERARIREAMESQLETARRTSREAIETASRRLSEA